MLLSLPSWVQWLRFTGWNEEIDSWQVIRPLPVPQNIRHRHGHTCTHYIKVVTIKVTSIARFKITYKQLERLLSGCSSRFQRSWVQFEQPHGDSQPFVGISDALFRQADIYAAHHSYIKKRKQTGHLHHPQQWGHQGSQGGKTGKARVDEGGQEQNVVSTSEHTYIHPEHLHIHVKTYSPGSRLHLWIFYKQ